MIQVRGLTKVFPAGPKAVDGLDFSVETGEILGFLGPNGAGKTTTIRVLSTLSGFDSGEVIVAGYNVDREPEKVRQIIGVVAQNTGIDYFLTGRENLELQGHLYRMRKMDILARIKELAQYFELEDALDRQVATYSGGMRRKLDIATALIHRPKLVFLDEPTLGLDIKSRKMLWGYIEKLNKEMGLTILLTTHYLEEADKLAHHVAIINAGKIRAMGTSDDLKRSIAGDALTLSFEKRDGAVQQFSSELRLAPYVKDLLWQGNRLHIYVRNGAESVPHITALANNMGTRILTLSLSRPSLDDVFLKYTGTSMTESGDEESGDEWWKQWAGKGGGSGKWQQQWKQGQAEEEKAQDPGEGAGGWQSNNWPQGGAGQEWPQQQWPATNGQPWQQDANTHSHPQAGEKPTSEQPSWSQPAQAKRDDQQWSGKKDK